MDYSSMSDLKNMIGQLFMIGIGGISLSEDEKVLIRNENIGFVILFSRNYSSPEQLRALTSEIHKLASPPPAIFIDQEGGPIVRLGESGSTVVSHMALAATGTKKNAEKAGKIIGKEMRSLGIDGVFAPVLDVNSDKNNPVIGIRAFSDDPNIVSELGARFFRGLKKGKVLTCGKHFPGHGHTIEDSHLKIPVSEIDKKFFSETNLPPFQKLIRKNIHSLMTAHVRFPLISESIATFSPEITIDLLRNTLNFNGVLFSDCVEMSAIRDNFSPDMIVTGFSKSSLDVISVSHSINLQKKLIEMLTAKLKSGDIPVSRLTRSVERVSALKKKIKKRGLLERFRKPVLRRHFEIEKKIANESITLLRNSAGLIPLDTNRKILIIDHKINVHSANTNNKNDSNALFSIGDRYLSGCKILIPQNDHRINEDEKRKILEYDHILVFDHSWSNKPDKQIAQEVYKIRTDLILICANNPYIAEKYNDVSTILLTYGSRQVQIEALFNILTGISPPIGKLPITLARQSPV